RDTAAAWSWRASPARAPGSRSSCPPLPDRSGARLRPMRPRLLIVDDEPSFRELFSMHLSDLGGEIATAGDGEEALAKVAGDRPDVVITDLAMPKMDGIELLKRLRGQYPDLPV